MSGSDERHLRRLDETFGPSPMRSELLALRAEVDRLTRERDEVPIDTHGALRRLVVNANCARDMGKGLIIGDKRIENASDLIAIEEACGKVLGIVSRSPPALAPVESQADGDDVSRGEGA
jgi:hypothetical protein